MPRGKISKRQQEIYDYIKSYTEEHAYPPSVREIGTAVGLASRSAAALPAGWQKLGWNAATPRPRLSPRSRL